MAVAAPLAALFLVGNETSAPDARQAAAQADLPFSIPTIGAEVWVVFVLFFLAGYLIYQCDVRRGGIRR